MDVESVAFDLAGDGERVRVVADEARIASRLAGLACAFGLPGR